MKELFFFVINYLLDVGKKIEENNKKTAGEAAKGTVVATGTAVTEAVTQLNQAAK